MMSVTGSSRGNAKVPSFAASLEAAMGRSNSRVTVPPDCWKLCVWETRRQRQQQQQQRSGKVVSRSTIRNRKQW
jgi:hypothetical protein